MMLHPQAAHRASPITFHFSPFTFRRLCSFAANLPGDFMRKLNQNWLLLCFMAVLFQDRSFADDGLWLFNNPPAKQLQDKYHFTPPTAWLEHIQKSSVRVGRGR